MLTKGSIAILDATRRNWSSNWVGGMCVSEVGMWCGGVATGVTIIASPDQPYRGLGCLLLT